MTTFGRLADLPLEIENYELEGLEKEASSDFTRLSTVIHLKGSNGHEGLGEDVTYEALDHVAFQDAGPNQPLTGTWTLGDFCAQVADLDLFPTAPERDVSRLYRRWAFDSAALDLALRQAGTNLAAALGLEPRPVTFVVSLRLGSPPSMEGIHKRLAITKDLRFKLDPTNDWDDALLAALVETGAVDSVDFKGHYKGTIVDQEPDPVLYRKVIESFPDAWIEDPAITDATKSVLAEVHDRITWDAPIHSIEEIEALPFAPKMVNVKPSRFGGLKPLLDVYDYLAERSIGAYGGGQFELGVGRGQIQYMASLFHPDTPNDVAPVGYNLVDPQPPLPVSPLAPAISETGFRWE